MCSPWTQCWTCITCLHVSVDLSWGGVGGGRQKRKNRVPTVEDLTHKRGDGTHPVGGKPITNDVPGAPVV